MLVIATMTEIANHAGNDPWPSLEAASKWFDRASIVLAISLLFGAVATVSIVWLGIVKEHHWDLLRERASEQIASVGLDAAKSNAEAAKAHERIAELSVQGEGLKKDAAEANAKLGATQADVARANAQIAEAQARTKEAELKLAEVQRQLEPRRLDGETFMSMLRDAPKAKIDLLYVAEDHDSYQLSLQIFWWLMHAGWDCQVEKPIPPVGADAPYPDKPAAWSVIARETGISLIVHDNDEMKPDTPYAALLNAFHKTPGQAETGIDERVPSGTIRVVVAPRPLPNNVWTPDDIFSDTRGRVLVE